MPRARKFLTAAISEMGIRVVPTWTNFLFCHVGEDVSSLCQLLQEDGVIVRPMNGPWGAPDAFRVTIGTREHNEQFVEALKRAMARIPELQ